MNVRFTNSRPKFSRHRRIVLPAHQRYIAGQMHVARLTLTDFRNHGATLLQPGRGLVVLAGANGAGKTNILEALSLLAPGRGLRGAALPEMVRDGAPDGFTIVAECADAALTPFSIAPVTIAPVTIGTGTRAATPGRRRVRINRAEAAATALGEWIALLWLTPAMDRLFTEAAGQRRRFLDRLVLALAPDHARHAARYEAAMRARSRLLATDGPLDLAWVAALEAQMAEHGALLDAGRHRLIAQLQAELAQAPDGPFARPVIALINPEGQPATPWQRARLAEALQQGRGRDARAGRALTGPHRTDLSVVHAAKAQPAARCSTGEQKALLLAIVLGHGDLVASARGRRPVLLLDELAAHLDSDRRAALFARLDAAGGQVWMTGTDLGLFAAVPGDATRLMVCDGEIAPA